ncbi:MAG: sugar phosphate nucleotidyltransferase [Tissierellia bacterium]|nr:sugar phosphate nucleotidyltransferase [Tissierellia bacterium]
MKKTLVIMAAGIGSRYGAGIKQLAKMTKNDETIIDFSVYDAINYGFEKVVFIIRKDIEVDFKNLIGDRISKNVEVAYAFQEIDHLPEGIVAPEGRKKPWGTVHALLAAKDLIDGPFLVINADDYYGKKAFAMISKFLDEYKPKEDKIVMAMCGYKLVNTLSDNGTVTRGISIVDEEGYLDTIIETKGIERVKGKLVNESGVSSEILNEDTLVSMNTWAGFPDLLTYVESSFNSYIRDHVDELETCEYVLPTMIDEMLKRDLVEIKVLETSDKWIGITYREDLEAARDEFRKMIDKKIYPEVLWQ